MFEPTAATRIAIEFLTLWIEPGTEARLTAARHIASVLREPGGEDLDSIVAGHLNLAMLLLFMLAKERGATEGYVFVLSRDIIRDLSRGLPE